jgi:uncharacterized short protein YbdD (DUF466 family)
MKLLSRLWSFARALTGDSAYETYAKRAARSRAAPLSPEAFYLDSLERRYSSPNRCC